MVWRRRISWWWQSELQSSSQGNESECPSAVVVCWDACWLLPTVVTKASTPFFLKMLSSVRMTDRVPRKPSLFDKMVTMRKRMAWRDEQSKDKQRREKRQRHEGSERGKWLLWFFPLLVCLQREEQTQAKEGAIEPIREQSAVCLLILGQLYEGYLTKICHGISSLHLKTHL